MLQCYILLNASNFHKVEQSHNKALFSVLKDYRPNGKICQWKWKLEESVQLSSSPAQNSHQYHHPLGDVKSSVHSLQSVQSLQSLQSIQSPDRMCCRPYVQRVLQNRSTTAFTHTLSCTTNTQIHASPKALELLWEHHVEKIDFLRDACII